MKALEPFKRLVSLDLGVVDQSRCAEDTTGYHLYDEERAPFSLKVNPSDVFTEDAENEKLAGSNHNGKHRSAGPARNSVHEHPRIGYVNSEATQE